MTKSLVFSMALLLNVSTTRAFANTQDPNQEQTQQPSDLQSQSQIQTTTDSSEELVNFEDEETELDTYSEDNSEPLKRVYDKKAHASKKLQIVVHKSMKTRGYQFLEVFEYNEIEGKHLLIYRAPVSTAWARRVKAPGRKRPYKPSTPPGMFSIDWQELRKESKLWDANLKYVNGFNNGVWLHATTSDHYVELGAPASGGCVRLHEIDARWIYTRIKEVGRGNIAITIIEADHHERQIPWFKMKLKKRPVELRQLLKERGIHVR